MDVTQILIIVGTLLIGMFIAYTSAKAYAWFNKNKSQPYGFALEWFVESSCELVEKLYVGKGRGKEKLKNALQIIEGECARSGITFDVDQITEMINKYVLETINAVKNSATSSDTPS